MRLSSKQIAIVCTWSAVFITGAGALAVSQVKSDSQPRSLTSINCPSSSGTTVVQTVPMPGRPGFLLLSKNTVWVAIGSSGSGPMGSRGAIVRIDARSGRIQRTFRLPIDPYQLAFGFGSLWVTGYSSNRSYQDRLLRIDPSTGRMVRLIRGPKVFGSKIATTSDAVWINGADIYPKGHSERAGVRFVYKIDPRRNTVVRRVRLPRDATVIDLLGDGSSLWSVGWWGVVKLSATGRVLFQQPIDGSGWSMALSPGTVWVAQPWFGTRPVRQQNNPARRLLRISISAPPRRMVLELPTQPGGIAAAGGIVWLGVNGGLGRIDATQASPTVTRTPVNLTPNYASAFPGGVWVSDLQANRVSKIC